MTPLEVTILRAAALLAPAVQRREWLAEWQSEAWYVRRSGELCPIRFCLGAFRDALWCRRNSPRERIRPWAVMRLPWKCVALLALMAVISISAAFQLPAARNAILPSPYRDPRTLVMVSERRNATAASFAAYRRLKESRGASLQAVAFYRPLMIQVRSAAGQAANVSVALASRDLFPVLGLSLPAADGSLVLSETESRKIFAANRGATGRTVYVAGRAVRVAAVIPDDDWRLPGRVDAWLLENEDLSQFSGPANGYIVARTNIARAYWRFPLGAEGGERYDFYCSALADSGARFAPLLAIGLALLLLPAVTSFNIGECPANRPWTIRCRRWIFLTLKIVLIAPLIYCMGLDFAALTSTPLQPHALLLGYILAFRWILVDQRKRCPVCLRTLTNPARIGSPAHILLEWYGAEFICSKGHGLMHVPATAASSYGPQRWMHLDASWSGLFT